MRQTSSSTIGCIEHAASVLGSKWTGQIIRELALGPKRFCELERALPALNPRTLSKRLDELSHQQIIVANGQPRGYSLTKKGSDLLPVLHEMVAWGTKHSRPPADT